MENDLVRNLLVILTAGLLVGVVCRKLGISILVGYLLIGTALGVHALEFIQSGEHEIELLAEIGVLLLLFSIGLELSLAELARLARWLVVGGCIQMTLVSVPMTLVLRWITGDWQLSILLGLAISFSSTVLVFKALAEWGQVESPHGRRAISILLFQDISLVPLLLLMPLLTETEGAKAGWLDYAQLLASSAGLVVGVGLLRWIVGKWIVPLLAGLRSPELLVLFTLVILGGVTCAAAYAKLPATLGAFAAGLVMSDNRLTAQIDALLLPFRESFSAIFFISLGLLFDPLAFWGSAGYLTLAMIFVIALKTVGGALALRATGLDWKCSWAMGLGLSQVGEFAFVVGLEGLHEKLLTIDQYQSLLAVALGSLILTPLFLGLSLKGSSPTMPADENDTKQPLFGTTLAKGAVVIGIGPVGRHVSSRLETRGWDVCLVDLSPVNLYQFAQQGFRTIAGDASDPEVLNRARGSTAELIVVCVPDDAAALRVVRSARVINTKCTLLVRCRYRSYVTPMQQAGASSVVSEEIEASEAIERLLAQSAET